MERGIRARMYFFAFVISALLFTVGIVLGWYFGISAVTETQKDFDRLKSEAYSLEILSLMGDSNASAVSCAVYSRSFGDLVYQTEQFGAKLDYLEKRKGKLDPEVMALKSDYSSMQMRNYLIQQKMDSKCGKSNNVILYFYSNENYSSATDEGLQIAQVDREFNVYTYHFDVNVQNPVVDALKESYGVVVTPTLIVNGNKLEGFKTAGELRAILSSQH